MSELSDLAADVAKDLPAQVRKVIDTAVENGWELNRPGMTLALRLNHPTDELAQPVYIVWTVGRTPKGALSFKFNSCGTKGLVPLKGPDLLEYLQDPTVIYPDDEDIAAKEAEQAKKAEKDLPPWDTNADAVTNLHNQLGAQVIGAYKPTAADLMAEQKARLTAPDIPPWEALDEAAEKAKTAAPEPAKPSGSQLRVSAPPLRIQAPKV